MSTSTPRTADGGEFSSPSPPRDGLAGEHAEVVAAERAEVIAERLVSAVGALESCLVAYSGGVDSAVVAKAAYLALGAKALAVTGVSPSLAAGEAQAAARIARSIGIAHREIATDEMLRDEYLRNAPDRCFHCKSELYDRLGALADELGYAAVVNGANVDDLGDFRPGMQAAAQRRIASPLADCGMDKAQVRRVAQFWDLEVWDKPATPCLSSRVAYGLSITPERLARIDAAERLLREAGLPSVRVRHHENELARLEVDASSLSRLCE
ncbi:MAG: ATP-dependent sacrificial sulfur transferase LarE, partial [Planctomycetales bacterium]|nr:ATP-dependent sacrificial sulfur transferase LarE [Planctomycetales bacterium]